MNHTTTSSSASSTFPHATGPVPTLCNDTSPACYPNDGNESLTATLGGGDVVFEGEVCNDLSPSCYPNDGNESGLAGDLGGAAARATAE